MVNEARRDERAGLLAKENLTTGEAARVLCVSPQVVVRCIDGGSLAGWKVPGSRARRIRTADLVAFARANGVPLPRPEPDPAAGGADPVVDASGSWARATTGAGSVPGGVTPADPPADPDDQARSGGHPASHVANHNPFGVNSLGEYLPGPPDGELG